MRSGHSVRRLEPDGVGLPPKRADHLGQDVEQEPELPLDRGTRYRGGGTGPISQPVGPLGNHRIAHLRDDAAGVEQNRLGSTH